MPLKTLNSKKQPIFDTQNKSKVLKAFSQVKDCKSIDKKTKK